MRDAVEPANGTLDFFCYVNKLTLEPTLKYMPPYPVLARKGVQATMLPPSSCMGFALWANMRYLRNPRPIQVSKQT